MNTPRRPARGFGLALAASALLLGTGLAPAAAADGGGIVNFSARAEVAAGAPAPTLGFVVDGNGNSFLLRGVGPGLAGFGVTGVLSDPALSLFRGSTLLARNDNWGSAFIAPPVGAFALPAASLDAGIWAALDRGAYTVQLSAAGTQTGAGLLEIYDARTGPGRLANLSFRGNAGPGDASLTAGFAIAGAARRQVLIRAIGPSLAGFGVAGVLPDTRIELSRADASGVLATSDRPGDPAVRQVATTQSGAFALAAGARDASLLMTLDPGTYSVRVGGATATAAGVALLELYDQPISAWPILSPNNAIYEHGDIINFDASGTYVRADGSKTVVTSGWLRLRIVDQGLRNPLNNNSPVMTLVESLMYDGYLAAADGKTMPIRFVLSDAIRGFVQNDPTGTIKYQADIVAESMDAKGAPVYTTYWFHSPRDYSQYTLPLAVGDRRVVDYDRRSVDGARRVLGHVTTQVDAINTVSTPMGKFDAYRMAIKAYITTGGTTQWVNDGIQYINPMIGAVGFEFFSLNPGETGSIVQMLSATNLPFDGAPRHPLADGNRRPRLAPGHRFTYQRSGFYIATADVVEDIGGSLTIEISNENVTNPVTRRLVLSLVETHVTDIAATTLASVTTRTSQRDVIRRYVEISSEGDVEFVGETGPNGQPVWFEAGYVPLPFPYGVGQSRATAVKAVTVGADGRPTTVFTDNRGFRVASTMRTTTALGTFEGFRLVATSSRAPTVDQYVHPALGVVRYRHEAPAGRRGYMDLTLSSTNVPFTQ